jgi:hypothetical protein
MEQLNAKALEKKAFRSFYKDGIYDLFIGLILLSFGLPRIFKEFGWLEYVTQRLPLLIPILLNVGALLFFAFGKKYITTPRLGVAHFHRTRKRKMMHVKLLLAISALIGAALFLLSLLKVFPVGGKTGIPLPLLIFGINALLVFSLIAYFMDFTRLYLYAFLFAISMPLAIWLKYNTEIRYPSLLVFMFTAGPMIVIGCVVFIQFINQFPIQKELRVVNEQKKE